MEYRHGGTDIRGENEILIKSEHLEFGALDKKRKRKEKKSWDSTTAITSSFIDSTPSDTTYISLSLSLSLSLSHTHTHTHTHTPVSYTHLTLPTTAEV